MPLLTERELRKMSVRPIVALCAGGLGAAGLFAPVFISLGITPWGMIAWVVVLVVALIVALVYVHRG